jgi:hypothetical protein
MIGGTNTAKIEHKLVQIGELFSEEFREPLKERVLEVLDQGIEKILAKKIDKLKGEKGDPAVVDYDSINENITKTLQVHVTEFTEEINAVIKADLAKRLEDANLLLVEKLKEGLAEADKVFKSMLEKDIEIEKSINTSISNIKETLQGSLDKAFEETKKTLEESIQESIKKTQETLNGTASKEIALLFEDFKKNFDSSSLKGQDAELDHELVKKEIGGLFEEWKSNLGDLTGKQGERGEKGKDGTEYPTGSKTVLGEMEEVFRYALPNELVSVELSIKGYTAARNICIAKKTGIWDGCKLISSFTNDKIELNPGRLEYSVEVIGTDLVFKGKGHKEQDTEMSVNWTVQVKVL